MLTVLGPAPSLLQAPSLSCGLLQVQMSWLLPPTARRPGGQGRGAVQKAAPPRAPHLTLCPAARSQEAEGSRGPAHTPQQVGRSLLRGQRVWTEKEQRGPGRGGPRLRPEGHSGGGPRDREGRGGEQGGRVGSGGRLESGPRSRAEGPGAGRQGDSRVTLKVPEQVRQGLHSCPGPSRL